MADTKDIALEEKKENVDKNELKLTKDNLPENVKYSLEPLSRELEDSCANIHSLIQTFFNQPSNKLEYGLLVVKVMEFVESLNKLSSQDKCTVATRCIIEVIIESDSIPEDTKNDLITTIPGSIEAVIQLTKGEPLNRNVKGLDIVESTYVTKRAVERIVEYIRQKNYNLQGILENIFMILTQIMYIVGSYPSLSGQQKKDIVVDVIRQIVTKYRDTETGKKIPDHFVKMVLDSVSSLVDILVSVSEGKFNINNVKKCSAKCFPCC
jgi:hypothetical protein